MNKLVISALVVTLYGCGGGSGGANMSCAPRSGSYKSHFVERDGYCGPIPDTVVVIGGATAQQLANSCVGTQDLSTDNCTITSDLKYPLDDKYTVKTIGAVHWSVDGNSASGTVQVVQTFTSTGYFVCSSLYDVTYTKI